MYFNLSNRFNPIVILKVSEHELLMRCNNALNESSNHTARASKDVLTQEARIAEAWTPDLGESCGKGADMEDEVVFIEKEESDHDCAKT